MDAAIRQSKVTEAWLTAFHAGEHDAIESCYRDHFETVMYAASAVLGGADSETVVHEVFYKLLTDPRTRSGFRGGSLSAWLRQVTRNRAIDFRRRHRLEQQVDPATAQALAAAAEEPNAPQPELRLALESFYREYLPPEWAPVFEARFMRQLSQREAASYLGMRRTTLAYQESRLRARLRRFLLRTEAT